jgi:hypothetical protein
LDDRGVDDSCGLGDVLKRWKGDASPRADVHRRAATGGLTETIMEFMVCMGVGALRGARVVVRARDEHEAQQRAEAYWRTRGQVIGEVLFIKTVAPGTVLARSAV